MAGNLPVGNDYQSFYGNIENSVLNRQFANEDQQMAMGRFAQEMAKNDMQAPEAMAQSRLNQLTHEKDTQLLPEKAIVEKQNINAEQKFNTAREMLALIDDQEAPLDQKEKMIQYGLGKIMDADPSMDEAKKAARMSYYLNLLRSNPEGAKKQLKAAMDNWSSTPKSVQAEEAIAARGREQQTNTLLREQTRAAGNAAKDPKSYHEMKVRDAMNYRRQGNTAAADAIEAGLKDWMLTRDNNAMLQQEQNLKVNPATGKVGNKATLKPVDIPVGVAGIAPIPNAPAATTKTPERLKKEQELAAQLNTPPKR
jgi:hypothetical protein